MGNINTLWYGKLILCINMILSHNVRWPMALQSQWLTTSRLAYGCTGQHDAIQQHNWESKQNISQTYKTRKEQAPALIPKSSQTSSHLDEATKAASNIKAIMNAQDKGYENLLCRLHVCSTGMLINGLIFKVVTFVKKIED